MNLNPAMILSFLILVLTSAKIVYFYLKRERVPSVNELISDIFGFFIGVTGIYVGFLVLCYGIFREPLPGTDIEVIFTILILAGFIIILLSGKWLLERMCLGGN